MKARQSKTAREIFSSETKGRDVLKGIHTASKKAFHVVADVKVGKAHIRVKEL
jgi:hypothetical protein